MGPRAGVGRGGAGMAARELLEVSLYADDLAAAERFYGGVLGLERIAAVPHRHIFFRCGGRVLLIFDPDRTAEGGSVPAHGARGPGHVAFAAAADEMDRWRAHLERAGVPVELDQLWPGGGRSLYFRDPAGNSLEMATPAVWRLGEAEALGTS